VIHEIMAVCWHCTPTYDYYYLLVISIMNTRRTRE
jgi:hypothetical protein